MKLNFEQRFGLVIIVYVVIMALLLSISVVTFRQMRELTDSTSAFMIESAALAALKTNIAMEMTPMNRLYLTHAKKDYLSFKEAARRVERSLDDLEIRADRKSRSNRAMARLRLEQSRIEDGAALLLTGDSELKTAARSEIMKTVDRSARQINHKLESWLTRDQKDAGQALAELGGVRAAAGWLFVVSFIMLVAVASAPLLLKSVVSKSLSDLSEGVRQVVQGNLDHRLEVETGDEIGELTKGFNTLTSALRQEESTAADIQHSLLPQRPLAMSGVRVVARQTQSKSIGGDWFDYYVYNDELRFMIADASGKGASGALLATLSMSAIRTEPKDTNTVEDILRHINTAINTHFGGVSFVTLFSGQIFLADRRLKMISCGHEPPLHFRAATGSWSYLPAPAGLPLGVSEELFDPAGTNATLTPGDKLFLYTDGLHDLRDETGDFLGMGPVLEWLTELETEPIETILDTVLEKALAFSSGPIKDDVTLVGLEVE